MVVSHQGGLSSGESHRGQSSAGESHQGRSSGVLLGGLLPGWSFIRVVSHHGSVKFCCCCRLNLSCFGTVAMANLLLSAPT